VILTAPATLAEARAAYADLKSRAAAHGRSPVIVAKHATDADAMATWFAQGGADGFLVPLPDDLVAKAIPELQRRGLMRTGYAGRMLRDHLQLPVPVNRYAAAASPTPSRE
jgi:alkanesulfonate monooxygenase SsuD/methylene tetrahydromethanopterin reductase-like flavin-dependent oxidoreductase (luciferase family)